VIQRKQGGTYLAIQRWVEGVGPVEIKLEDMASLAATGDACPPAAILGWSP